MAYAVRADLEAAFGRKTIDIVADRDEDGIADGPVIAAALAAAEAEVNTYLEQRYSLPFAMNPLPAILKQLVVDIAIYRLAHPVEYRTDEMRRRYEDAIKLLQAIVEGKAAIPGATEADQGPSDGTVTFARFLKVDR